MLPLLSVIVGSTQPPAFVGAEVDVVLEREGCLSDLERISVRRLAAISDLVSPKQLSLTFRWLLTLTFAPRAEFRLWIRDSLGFNILRVLAARFNDLYSDFDGAQGIFFPNMYLNQKEYLISYSHFVIKEINRVKIIWYNKWICLVWINKFWIKRTV